MQVLILVGGLGTRLRASIGPTPKPMASVAGRPFVEYLLLQLRRDGFQEVIMLAGFGATVLHRYFGDGRDWGISIAYSNEPERLGTAGAVRHSLPMLEGQQFLVMNGDSFFDIPLLDLIAAHTATPLNGIASTATLALARSSETERFGSVELGAANQVTRFREKVTTRGEGLINAGVYVLERATIEAIPPARTVSLEHEVFPGLINRGLRGIEMRGTFLDIGIPQAYEALRSDPTAVLSVA